jgi:8-oxo-dGTP pyrophosphatase MutT (NUDIX family)
MNASFDYDLTAQLNDGTEVKLDPEVHGWAEPERLAKVKVWSIVPRAGGLPLVVVQIPEGAKPIFKSRWYGKLAFDLGFRAYAIGWHDTESHWTWVMPNGIIEVGEDPLYADLILRQIFEAAKRAWEEAQADEQA